MTTLTCRPVLRYAVGLVLAAGLAACGSDAGSTSGTSSSESSGSATSGASSSSPSSPSSSSGASSSGASSSGDSSSSTPAQRTIAVTVRGNRVTPAPRTVELKVGETITLEVTSDHADQLHVHGFDIEKELPAGTPVRVELTGESPGVYEVETHEPSLRLLKIAVQ